MLWYYKQGLQVFSKNDWTVAVIYLRSETPDYLFHNKYDFWSWCWRSTICGAYRSTICGAYRSRKGCLGSTGSFFGRERISRLALSSVPFL